MAKTRRKPASRGRSKTKIKGWFSGEPTTAMLFKLLFAFLLFFVSRILFYLLNLDYFSGLSFRDVGNILFYGLRFDLAGFLILNAPFILLATIPFRLRFNKYYMGFTHIVFYLLNGIGLMVNFIDTIYFRFTLKRLTADIFQYLGVGGDFQVLIPQFIRDFWYVMLIWIGFVALLVWIGRKFKPSETGKGIRQPGYFLLYGLIFLVICFMTVVGIRGGFQLRPIAVVTAGKYVTAKYVPVLINTPFSIAKSVGHEGLKQLTYFRTEKELRSVFEPVNKMTGKEFQPLNVMVIIMESWSREHVGSLNPDLEDGRYLGFTPFMDSLIRQGYYFDAVANTKTSINAIPAILSGVPGLMDDAYIQSRYSGNRVVSLAGHLKPRGYTTAFFHGGTNGTMGFDGYTRMIGFSKYYGRSEYDNERDYDGKWGIRDEEFLQFMARTISTFRQPFLAGYFSLSSHHPYYVPGKYTHQFRKGNLPIQQSIMYSDYALSKFFHRIKHENWFYNTLFVITADHTSEGYYPYYQTSAGQHAIPLLFYKPGSNLNGKSREIAQQADIMPTVLGFLGYDKDFISFGNNLFDSTSNRFAVYYTAGIYSLIKDGYLLEFDGTRPVALFDLRSDKLQRTNLLGTKEKKQKDLELFLKAYIQQYNNRVIENRLTLD